MKKLLSVLMILSMLLSFVPVSAFAATTGSYGVDLSSDGYGSLNIYSKPQCTWYCWGRTYELYGIKFPNFGNAKDWYSAARSKGYSVGTTCKVGSIAVFKDIGSDTSGYGHVAYVEKISGSTAYISEGNFSGTTYHEGSYNCSTGKRFAGTDDEQQIVGYIYPSGSSSGTTTTVEVSFDANSKENIGTTNAVLAKTISVTGVSISAVSQVGIRLYNASGTQLGYKFESPVSKDGVINVWYDVNSELGVTLTPNTTYKYRIYATVNGAEKYKEFSFTTAKSSFDYDFVAYSKHSVSTTNAVLAKTLKVTGVSIDSVTSVGIRLYNAAGTLLASKTEVPTPKDGVINIWYDVNSELGVTLTPSTSYSFTLFAVIGGTTYYSDPFPFTTASTGITVKFTTYATKYSVGTTNAVPAKTISVTGTAITNVSKVGIKLYTASGSLMASKTETPTPKDGVINAWYDINSELNKTLTPGTKYKYEFFAIINNVTYTSEEFSFTTTPIYVTSVTLNKSTMALDVTSGTTGSLTATIAPTNATNKSVTWSSSNTAVATVNAGVVTPRSVGTAVITATAADGSGKKATCTVTVTAQLTVSGLTIVGGKTTAKTGQKATWVAEAAGGAGDVTYNFIILRDDVQVYDSGWISEPTLTYTFTEPGTYIARVSADDSGDAQAATAQVAAEPIVVTQAAETIVLSRSSVVLASEGPGSQAELSWSFGPENADVDMMYWSSSDTGVVTVTSSGVLIAQAEGTATITATADGGASDQCEVTVTADMPTLTLPASTLTVEDEAFRGSSAYERVILPEGLETIGANAFRDATGLRYVSIPKSVTSIGELAFEGCPEVLILCEEGSAAQNHAIDQGLPFMLPVDTSSAVPVQLITLSETAHSLTEGQSFTLTAAVSPSDATDQRIIWSSSNPSVADVADGVVTGYAAGSATITAASADGNAQATCEVTVTPVLVTSITLSASSLTLNIDDTVYLTPTILPVEASGAGLTWKTSNASVATVSNGNVTAVGAGSATITAVANDGSNVSASCSITVKPRLVSSITISKSSISLVAGNTYTLTATAYPTDAANRTIVWASNNTAVATVSSSGVVTGKAPGSTTIVASANDGSGVTAKCTVTVTAKQQASGVVQHPTITSSNAWYRLYPTIDHLSFGETTNASHYAAIINQFDVTWGENDSYVDGWYEPGTTYHSSTYCNYFAVDVAYAMGCFIPIANTCENCGCPVGSSAVKSHTASGTIYTSNHYMWTGITNYGMTCTCDNRSIPSGWGMSRVYKWFMGSDGNSENANAYQFCWVECTAAEAVEAANRGYMTVGLNTGHIFVVYPHGGSAMYISQAGSNLMSNEAMPYTKSDYKYFYNIGGV